MDKSYGERETAREKAAIDKRRGASDGLSSTDPKTRAAAVRATNSKPAGGDWQKRSDWFR